MVGISWAPNVAPLRLTSAPLKALFALQQYFGFNTAKSHFLSKTIGKRNVFATTWKGHTTRRRFTAGAAADARVCGMRAPMARHTKQMRFTGVMSVTLPARCRSGGTHLDSFLRLSRIYRTMQNSVGNINQNSVDGMICGYFPRRIS